ncbi:hypothetical protein SADUNF_Sadunf08G0069600 [Salix dunnii]|uniref:Uncharacterized protein n=1 Tax=Salix dunnii TaxID=1413687 RepID=A0A835JXQ0_9ROSI|nr:hypothetical protein SADUNF_Sadunf08G0069600 [Salix dunnii]
MGKPNYVPLIFRHLDSKTGLKNSQPFCSNKTTERERRPSKKCTVSVVTGVQTPFLGIDGRSISKVKRVPVGRNLADFDILEIVFCIPLATALLLLPGSLGALGSLHNGFGRFGSSFRGDPVETFVALVYFVGIQWRF